MLGLRNIKKSYKTGEFVQHALKGIDVKFRTNEFVAILGPSGSGKTTLLNIIGGLDRYDSGDLIINGRSTKKFKDGNWDSYRNNCVGFIFQSYNLISHISILENVEMSTILSGYSKKKRRKMATQALEKVGLINHIHKKPNQLSGGQMQRVAIARALVNNPDIILADEPTGALDTKTSKQIMDLIKEIAKDKLVIMVTHNPELAKEYATRIIEFRDGEILKDSNPISDKEKQDDKFKIKKTAMSYKSAISLSFNNLKTKKGRTLITSFASSIGIIGIALILALSNGFQIKIDEFEKSTLSQAPIIISEQAITLDNMVSSKDSLEEYSKKRKIYPLKTMESTLHKNKITKDYVNYIESIDSKLVGGISYFRTTSFNMLTKVDDKVKNVDTSTFFSIPSSIDGKTSQIMTDNFEIIYGKLSDKKEDIYLLVDSKNRINENILKELGLGDKEKIDFNDIVGKEFKVVLNNQYYKKIDSRYVVSSSYDDLYNNSNNITLHIAGVIRGKKDNMYAKMSSTGLVYNTSLINFVIKENKNSEIVREQLNKDYNVLTLEKFEDGEEGAKNRDAVLAYLGDDNVPQAIQVYPKDFSAKKKIVEYLDKYNKNKDESNKILYTDQAELITSLSGNIMDAITIVLIAFSSISLIVSSIMVGIITYTSVLERTKEIGILRALGARKKDITRVFNAETLIIGLCSGFIGILIARILIFPVNIIIKNLSSLDNVARLNPLHALIMILISILLTLIGGLIPAKIASKKDPVVALRSE